MSLIEFHRQMLGDSVRNAALARALKAAITPGVTTVSDIGSGTGVLGMLAESFGALSVTLYESGDVISLSKRIAKESGMKKCKFVRGYSMSVRHPERTDVVISETLGNFALEEHILETLQDARKRFLKAGGTIIPCKLRQFVAPVIAPRLWNELSVWDRTDLGVDFSAAKDMSMHNLYVRRIGEDELLEGMTSAKIWDSIDFTREEQSIRKGEARWNISHTETVYGFAVWWEADLGSGITLSTSPFQPPTHWEQMFLPVMPSLPCPAGAVLTLTIHSDTRMETGVHVEWNAAVTNTEGTTFAKASMNMKKGFLG